MRSMKLTTALTVLAIALLSCLQPVGAQTVFGGELWRSFSDAPAPRNPDLLSGVDYEFNGAKRANVDSMVSTDTVVFAGVAGQTMESSDTIIDPDATRGRDGQLAGKFSATVFNPVFNRWEGLQRGAANQYLSRVETSRLSVGAHSWVVTFNYSSGRAHSGFYVPWAFGLKITLVAKNGQQEASIGRRILVIDSCGWPMGSAREIDQARSAYFTWRMETPGLRTEAPYYMPTIQWGQDHGFLPKSEVPATALTAQQIPGTPAQEAPAQVAAPTTSVDPQVLARLRRLEGVADRQEGINRNQQGFNAQTVTALGALSNNIGKVAGGVTDTQTGVKEVQAAFKTQAAQPIPQLVVPIDTANAYTLDDAGTQEWTYASGKKVCLPVKLLKACKHLLVTVTYTGANGEKDVKHYELDPRDPARRAVKVFYRADVKIDVTVCP